MSDRKIVITHEGVDYYGQVGVIKSTMFGYEDHGILTAYLHFNGDGWGVAVGGYCLDVPGEKLENVYPTERVGTAYGLDHLMALMAVVGVSRWEDLPGKQAIVLYTDPLPWGSAAVGIAHATDEKRVLILANHAQAWKDRTEAVSR
ncbi:MAG TPA: hypothetical protein VHA75_20465 [Rugosimonospora sp.]|nr:hypothetical protein [Rugosimonospora sp.]